MPFLAYWVDNLNPFLVRFGSNFGIRYYGLAYVTGFVFAWWLLGRYAQAGKSRVPPDRIADLMTAVIVGVLAGGRIGDYLLYDGWKHFFSDPLEIFRVWEGGMASHGGMIGVAIALLWFARSSGIPFLHVGDLIASTTSAGLFVGRIANFINGELWGKITTVPWAVIFPRSMPEGTPIDMIPPRHPSQLYEAGMEGALLFAYMQARFWRSDAVREHPGRLSGEFFLIYAPLRIFGERFREPDASLILGLSRGTFYSLFLVAIGLFLVLRRSSPLPPAAPRTAENPR
jgi:phosphatidylglycerol:prolipoprotein diacylglycerol transferase